MPTPLELPPVDDNIAAIEEAEENEENDWEQSKEYFAIFIMFSGRLNTCPARIARLEENINWKVEYVEMKEIESEIPEECIVKADPVKWNLVNSKLISKSMANDIPSLSCEKQKMTLLNYLESANKEGIA